MNLTGFTDHGITLEILDKYSEPSLFLRYNKETKLLTVNPENQDLSPYHKNLSLYLLAKELDLAPLGVFSLYESQLKYVNLFVYPYIKVLGEQYNYKVEVDADMRQSRLHTAKTIQILDNKKLIIYVPHLYYTHPFPELYNILVHLENVLEISQNIKIPIFFLN